MSKILDRLIWNFEVRDYLRIVEQKSPRLRLIINITVMCFALYAVSRRELAYDAASPFEKYMIEVMAPIQRVIVSMKSKVTTAVDDYFFNVGASDDNRLLRKKLLEYESKLFQSSEVDLENKRLRGLLAANQEIKAKRLLAQIVAWDASSDFKVIRINRGSNDGLKLLSPIITDEGLVGYVYRLTYNYADVLTILDANNRIDAIVERERTHGIVEGYSKNRCMMKYVARTAPLLLGDLVMTSGLGNIYPKGIKIGKITRIEKDSYGITQHVELTPAVDFGKLEEVIVLLWENEQEKRKQWDELDEAGRTGGEH